MVKCFCYLGKRNSILLEFLGSSSILRLKALAVTTPWGIELNHDQVLGLDKMGKRVTCQHVYSLVFYHQVVAFWCLKWIDIWFQISLIFPTMNKNEQKYLGQLTGKYLSSMTDLTWTQHLQVHHQPQPRPEPPDTRCTIFCDSCPLSNWLSRDINCVSVLNIHKFPPALHSNIDWGEYWSNMEVSVMYLRVICWTNNNTPSHSTIQSDTAKSLWLVYLPRKLVSGVTR